jgi:hypothetical protein
VADNAVAKIDKKIEQLGDLADLGARVEHARRLEGAAKRAWEAFIAQNFRAVVASITPEAKAMSAAIRAAGDQLAAALDDWLRMHGRSVGLTVPVAGIDGRSVPDPGPIVGLKRSVENLDVPPPLPSGPSS